MGAWNQSVRVGAALTALALLAGGCAVPRRATDWSALPDPRAGGPASLGSTATGLQRGWGSVTGLHEGTEVIVRVDDPTVVDVLSRPRGTASRRLPLARTSIRGWSVRADAASLVMRPRNEGPDLWRIDRDDVVQVTATTIVEDSAADGALIGAATGEARPK